MRSQSLRRRWIEAFGLPAVCFAVLLAAGGLLFDGNGWSLVALPFGGLVGMALTVFPSAVLMLVRLRPLFVVGVVALVAAAAIAALATAVSDDAQAGLNMLWLPWIGGLAAIALAIVDYGSRRFAGNRP